MDTMDNLKADIYDLITEAHQCDDPDKLVALHRKAYNISQDPDLQHDHKFKAICAFNLGAALMENGEHGDALDNLNEAEKLYHRTKSTDHLGDLHFNRAVANYRLGDYVEAFRLLVDALGNYRAISETGDKDNMVDECWQTMRQIVSETATSSDGHKAEIAKSYQAQLDSKIDIKPGERTEQSRVWNELGLLNTQLHEYTAASYCFNKAEDILKEKDILQKAVILQNKGALCNFQQQYKQSVEHHKKAIQIYEGMRDGQEKHTGMGQCYLNVAHAYCRLEGPHSERALQHFKDAKEIADKNGDKHLLWQACEGLGAVYFNLEQYEESVNSYREASHNVFDTDSSRRISSKLEKAVIKQAESRKEKEDAKEKQALLENSLKAGQDSERKSSRRGSTSKKSS